MKSLLKNPKGVQLGLVLLMVSYVQCAFADPADVAFRVISKTEDNAVVKIAEQVTPGPLVIYQKDSKNVMAVGPDSPEKRLPFPASRFVDVKEDGSEALFHYDINEWSRPSVPTAVYRANLRDGTAVQIPGSGLIPLGYTGDLAGTVLGSTWFQKPGAAIENHWGKDLDLKSWYFYDTRIVSNSEGNLMAYGGRLWTAATGPIALNNLSQDFDEFSAFSPNGKWLVASSGAASYHLKKSLWRFKLGDHGSIGEKAYLHVPADHEVISITRVLDDGTVFATLSKYVPNSISQHDPYIWYPSGRFERLVDAFRRVHGAEVLSSVDWLGTLKDVSSDGRWFVGCKETSDESTQYRRKGEAWVLETTQPLTSLSSAPILTWVKDTLEIFNEGSEPLIIYGGTFSGPDAQYLSLVGPIVGSSYSAFTPLTIQPGERRYLNIRNTKIGRDVIATLNLQSNDPRPSSNIREVYLPSSLMPQIYLGASLVTGLPGEFYSHPIPAVTDIAVGRQIHLSVSLSSTYVPTSTQVSLVVECDDPEAFEATLPAPFAISLFRQNLLIPLRMKKSGRFTLRVRAVADTVFRPSNSPPIEIQAKPPLEIELLSEDGTRVIDPLQEVIDFQTLPQSGNSKQTFRIRNLGNESVDLRGWLGEGVQLGAQPRPITNFVFLPRTYTDIYALQRARSTLAPGAEWKFNIGSNPQKLGVSATNLIFDDPGLLVEPLSISVRVDGTAASAPFFVTQPSTQLLLKGETPPFVEVQGSDELKYANEGEFQSKTLLRGETKIPYDLPGVVSIKLWNSMGAATSSKIYFSYISCETGQQKILPGTSQLSLIAQAFFFSYLKQSPLTYRWMKDGTYLVESVKAKGTRTQFLDLRGLTQAEMGQYACEVTLAGPDRTVTRVFPSKLLSWEVPVVPDLVAVPFSLRRAREGESFSFILPWQVGVTSVVSGLPPGIRYNSVTGMIEGTVAMTAAGDKPTLYQVRVEARSGNKRSQPLTVPWIIEPYEHFGIAGNYSGLIGLGFGWPEGAKVTVTLNMFGSGTFVAQGVGRPRQTGTVSRLVSAGPAGGPDTYDPPLPQMMQAPSATHGLLLLSSKREIQGDYIVPSFIAALGYSQGILAGNVIIYTGDPITELMAFRQTKPSSALLPASRTAPFNQKLVPSDWREKVWQEIRSGVSKVEPGFHAGATTLTDIKGRLHLMCSQSPTSYDHWFWEPKTRQWFEARSALGIPVNDPYPPMNESPVVWRSSDHTYCWLFASDGSLWRFSGESARWTMLMSALPAGSPGNPGILGMPAPENRPRGRSGATTWLAEDGKLWMYGGMGELYDLWCFNPADGMWTWKAGRALLATEGADWSSDGVVAPDVPGSGFGWIGKDGRLWMYYNTDSRYNRPVSMWVFDPSNSKWIRKELPRSANTNPGTRYGQSVHTWMTEKGEPALFGGFDPGWQYYPPPVTVSDQKAWRFDLDENRWVSDSLGDLLAIEKWAPVFRSAQKWDAGDQGMYVRGNINTVGFGEIKESRFFNYGARGKLNSTGFLSSSLATTGGLSWTGSLPDDEAILGTSVLSKLEVEIPGYPANSWVAPVYSVIGAKGRERACSGMMIFLEDGSCASSLLWWRPVQKKITDQRLLPFGFPESSLLGLGMRYDATRWQTYLPGSDLEMDSISGLTDNSINFSVDSRRRLDIDIGPSSPTGFRFTFAPSSGLFTAAGTLPGVTPRSTRPLKLRGLLVPEELPAGYFTLPELPDQAIVPVQKSEETTTGIGTWRKP
jgi:hypothetical protein